MDRRGGGCPGALLFSEISGRLQENCIRGANTNGDSDSIACIAGGISGAYLGIDAIPDDWINRIEKTDYLNALAKRLVMKKDSLENDR